MAAAHELSHLDLPEALELVLLLGRTGELTAAAFKTELIADRVWRSCSHLELAILEWVNWFNTSRLHGSLGDLSPAEFETLHALQSLQSISLVSNEGTN